MSIVRTTKRSSVYLVLGTLLGVITFPNVLKSQVDTTKVEEEIIILSSETNKNPNTNIRIVEYKVKPIFRNLSPWERLSIIKFGYSPTIAKTRHGNIGSNTILGYERKSNNASFSFGAISSLRLTPLRESSYDYRDNKDVNVYSTYYKGGMRSAGSYFTHYFTSSLLLRFYYQQKRRMQVGASGNNFSQPYFYVKVRDVLSYTKRTTFEIGPGESVYSGELLRVTERDMWLAKPSYALLGWGIQRPLLKYLWLEIQMAIGTQLPMANALSSTKEHFVGELKFFIGGVFGTKKPIKK